MKAIKYIKDERGKLEIITTLWIDNYYRPDINGNLFRYDTKVMHTPPKKRNAFLSNTIATEDEIKDAQLEFWQSIKPS